jgi:hypothetical protein
MATRAGAGLCPAPFLQAELFGNTTGCKSVVDSPKTGSALGDGELTWRLPSCPRSPLPGGCDRRALLPTLSEDGLAVSRQLQHRHHSRKLAQRRRHYVRGVLASFMGCVAGGEDPSPLPQRLPRRGGGFHAGLLPYHSSPSAG